MWDPRIQRLEQSPVVGDDPQAEQMKSPSPVLHYAEGTGKISAPLAEEGHDRLSPWAWAFRWAWSKAIGAGRGPQIVWSVTTLG